MNKKIIILSIIVIMLSITIVESDGKKVSNVSITNEGNEITTFDNHETQIIFGKYSPTPEYAYTDNRIQLNYTIGGKEFDECSIIPMLVTKTQIDQAAITHTVTDPKTVTQLSVQEVTKSDLQTNLISSTKDTYVYEHTMNPSEVKNFYYQLPDNAYFDGGIIYCGKFKINLNDAIQKQGMKIDYIKDTNQLNFTGDYTLIDPNITFDTSQTICGTYTYDNIIINNSATLQVCNYNAVGQNGTVTFNPINFYMTTGTIINGTLKGYSGGSSASNNGTGPGFGQSNGTAGVTYGSSTNVTSMGSGGAAKADGYQVAGGGLIIINASTYASINGTINSNSGPLQTTGTNIYSGGSGGGINIYAKTIEGSFNVSVVGGYSGRGSSSIQSLGGASYGGVGGVGATSKTGGAGAGGRIYITYCDNNSIIDFNISGGIAGNSGTNQGQNGSVGTYLMERSIDCTSLITSATLLTPTNGTYWTSVPNITGTCTGTGNITASLFLNNVFNVNNSNVTSSVVFSLNASLFPTTEYTAYINCSSNASSMLSNNLTFYNVGTPITCIKTIGNGCAASISNNCYVVSR